MKRWAPQVAVAMLVFFAACSSSVDDTAETSPAGVVPATGAPAAAPTPTAVAAEISPASEADFESEVTTDRAEREVLRTPTVPADWGEQEFSARAVLEDAPAMLPPRDDRQTTAGGRERLAVEAVDWRAAFSSTGRVWPPVIESMPPERRDELVLDLFCSVQTCGSWVPGGTGLSVLAPHGLYRTVGQATAFEEEFGFALENIAAAARVSSGRSEMTLASGVALGAPFVPAGSIESLGTGDDYALIGDQASEWRDWGEPIRAAERDGVIGLALSTPLIEEWRSGERRALTSVIGVAEVAAALDEFSLFSFIVEAGDFRSRSCSPELAPYYEVTEPFDVVGLGFTVIDGRRTVVSATAFGTESAALAMVEPTRNTWTGFIDPIEGIRMSDAFELIDVSVEGAVVTAIAAATDDTRLSKALTFLRQRAPTAGYCE